MRGRIVNNVFFLSLFFSFISSSSANFSYLVSFSYAQLSFPVVIILFLFNDSYAYYLLNEVVIRLMSVMVFGLFLLFLQCRIGREGAVQGRRNREELEI